MHGKINEDSRNGYRRVINNLVGQGAEGIVLGCTEIPLLISPNDAAVPTYDTATIHAKAILEYSIN